MPYTPFDPTKPDGASQAGTAFGQSTRDNLKAVRDAVALGSFPGFNFSKSGGTAEEPAIILLTKGTEIIKATLTWTAGNVTTAAYAYSSNSGTTYDAISTKTLVYDAASNLVSTSWA